MRHYAILESRLRSRLRWTCSLAPRYISWHSFRPKRCLPHICCCDQWVGPRSSRSSIWLERLSSMPWLPPCHQSCSTPPHHARGICSLCFEGSGSLGCKSSEKRRPRLIVKKGRGVSITVTVFFMRPCLITVPKSSVPPWILRGICPDLKEWVKFQILEDILKNWG